MRVCCRGGGEGGRERLAGEYAPPPYDY